MVVINDAQNKIVLAFLCFALIGVYWLGAVSEEELHALSDYMIEKFGIPPTVPEGPLSEDLSNAVGIAFAGAHAPAGSVSRSTWDASNSEALLQVVTAGDPRVAGLVSSLLHFSREHQLFDELANAGASSLGIEFNEQTANRWDEPTDHLIA